LLIDGILTLTSLPLVTTVIHRATNIRLDVLIPVHTVTIGIGRDVSHGRRIEGMHVD
jgi:hypothetical protein